MAGSVYDSPLLAKLFNAGEVSKLFTDSAEMRALLIIEGALAKAQGAAGVIPEISAAAIHRAAMEVQIDPAGLAGATATDGVCIPAFVAAFRTAMEAPEHSQYIHFGATSQDILDTGLMLRLRQVLTQYDALLAETLAGLGKLAKAHAELPMAGRTYGQHATPVSFGSVIAHWGAPLLDLHAELPALRERVLWVSLSGAAGTGAAMGPKAEAIRTALAAALGLRDPRRSWHSDRSPILALSGWLARLGAALGKMAEDLLVLTMTGIGEVILGTAGGSSTMPQKQNPVKPSAILALTRQINALNGALLSAGSPTLERDGSAWFTEWLTVPQLCLSGAAILEQARSLSQTLAPDADAMRAALTSGQGLIYAEALSFALAQTLPRPEAQAAVKNLCLEATKTGAHLAELAAGAFPDMDVDALFDPARQMGNAPAEARRFAKAATSLEFTKAG